MSGRRLAGEAWRFFLVSLAGVVVDLALTTSLAGLGLWLPLAASLGLATAVVLNYLLHLRYTFASSGQTFSWRGLAAFAASSLVTLAVRLGCLALLAPWAHQPWLAPAVVRLTLAAGVSLAVSFLVCKGLVFRRRP